jgi:CMP-N,N'-diacetyllegionaminic acid synthase
MRVLGIVPARGGSKGIPRKNLRLLGGKPLLAWTAEAALASVRLARVILSTDDPEIAAVGAACGLDVPFLRGPQLASDTAPTLPVVVDAVGRLERDGDHYDAVCLLQPTSPFRPAEDIDGCIELLESSGADSTVAVLPVPPEHNPHWVYFRDAAGFLRLSTGEPEPVPRRQDLPAAFYREGSVYVTRRDVLMLRHSLYGDRVAPYVVERGPTVNLDTLEDWRRAEALVAVPATR